MGDVKNAGAQWQSLKKALSDQQEQTVVQYLEDDDRDDGNLWAEPREETLKLTTLTNQVTIHYDGNQAHGFHRRLGVGKRRTGFRLNCFL